MPVSVACTCGILPPPHDIRHPHACTSSHVASAPHSGIEDCAGPSCRENFEAFFRAGTGRMAQRQEPPLVNMLVLGLHSSGAPALFASCANDRTQRQEEVEEQEASRVCPQEMHLSNFPYPIAAA